MKQLLLLFSIVLPFIQLQAQFSDDFKDGNFSTGPGWNGDISDFIVNPDLQLQLNAPVAGSSVLSTAYEIPDSCVWEFYFKMDFGPSTANLLRIYIQCSAQDLLSGKGYFVEIGESGNADAIKFFRQDGVGSKVLLGTGAIGSVANQPVSAKLKINKSNKGDWVIATDYAGGNNPITEFIITDNTYSSGQSYFGLYCLYTETRKDKFFFDDIKCYQPQKDLKAPVLISWEILDQNHLDLVFDENLNKVEVEASANYNLLPSIGNPSIVTLDLIEKHILHLEFDDPLVNQSSYNLSVKNITDLYSNVSPSFDIEFSYLVGLAPGSNEILINEILPDPTPEVGLPPFEFIELYNNSNKLLSLKGLILSDATTTISFPAVVIEPGKYLILCNKADTASFKIFGPTIGLSNFPSLNNTGDMLFLRNEDDEVLNSVAYTDNWYGDVNKKNGGWSLELINPLNECLEADNWKASDSPIGGTPGQENSIYNPSIDNSPPVLLSVTNIDDYTLELRFNEKIAEDADLLNNLFSIDQSINILEIHLNLNGQSLTLILDQALVAGTDYNFKLLPGFPDCAGNQTVEIQSILFTIPSEPELLDIIINEVLFDPRSGGVDFIELYNRSGKSFNTGDLIIANTLNGLDKKTVSVSKLFLPGQFLVLTENPNNIKTEYEVKDTNVIHKIDLPSLNDDKGKIELLFSKANVETLIDSFSYDDSYHYALLNDKEGVSLERISPEVFLSGSANWQSASFQSGFATPTYKNSQYNINPKASTGNFILSSNKLSPDSDGFEDQIQIIYKLEEPGYTLNMDIYDSSGRKIKKLADNELLGSEGAYKWDGTTDENTKARLGIYIVFIEYFNLKGTVLQQKLSIVVAGKMN